jgi:hypothetical protein
VNQGREFSRREFLAFGGALAVVRSPFHHLPWWRPKEVAIAGARFRIVRSKLKHKPSRRRYLLIHGDERTAREVLLQHMRTHSGVAFVTESQTRNVPIASGQIDPNRMFSRRGAEASLRSLNPDWTAGQMGAALDLLDGERERFLDAILPSGRDLMVALHNNTEYSFAGEEPVSDQSVRNQPGDLHAFFLCTDPADYQLLAASPYNAVLQARMRTPDDGSLSRRAAARRLRYVNLEVKEGDAARQREMLDWVEAHLPE